MIGITLLAKWKLAIAVAEHPELVISTKLVALSLLGHLNCMTGLCCPSEKRLADKLGLSLSTVKRGIAELARHSIIEAAKDGRRNCYTFSALPEIARTRSGFVVSIGVTDDPHSEQQGSPMSAIGVTSGPRIGATSEPLIRKEEHGKIIGSPREPDQSFRKIVHTPEEKTRIKERAEQLLAQLRAVSASQLMPTRKWSR